MVSFSPIGGTGSAPPSLKQLIDAGGEDFSTALEHVSSWFVDATKALKRDGSGVLPAWDVAGLGNLARLSDAEAESRSSGVAGVCKSWFFPICGKATEIDEAHLAAMLRIALEMFNVACELFGEPAECRQLVQVEMTRRFLVCPPHSMNQAVWTSAITLIDFGYSIGLYEAVYQGKLGTALRQLFKGMESEGGVE